MSDRSGLEDQPGEKFPLRWLIFGLAIVSLSKAPLWGPISFVALGLAVMALLRRLENTSRVLPYIGLFVVTSVLLGSVSNIISPLGGDMALWRTIQAIFLIASGSMMFIALCLRIVADVRHGSDGTSRDMRPTPPD